MRELWGANKNQRLAARWYPKGAMAINHPDGLGVAYVAEYSLPGTFQVVAYRGTAGKPDFNFVYKRRELAEKKVEEFFISLLAHKVRVLEYRKSANQPHQLKVGDIITNSWGYDQTNVDCYQITRTTEHFVFLRPIASKLIPDEGCGPMSGRVVPIPGQFAEKGEETQHKATHNGNGDSVCFKHGSGSKWDGRSLYCSWYA